jgi:hypothetical protein
MVDLDWAAACWRDPSPKNTNQPGCLSNPHIHPCEALGLLDFEKAGFTDVTKDFLAVCTFVKT